MCVCMCLYVYVWISVCRHCLFGLLLSARRCDWLVVGKPSNKLKSWRGEGASGLPDRINTGHRLAYNATGMNFHSADT